MEEDIIKEFHLRNNLKNLKNATILCTSCGNWLFSPIFIHADAINYCVSCSSSKTSTKVRNYALEDILGELLYPCKYCRHFVNQDILMEHMETCKNALISCNLCKKDNNLEKDDELLEKLTFTAKSMFQHIINNHPEQILEAVEGNLFVELNLQMPMKSEQIYLIRLNSFIWNQYIIKIIPKKKGLEFLIAAQESHSITSLDAITIKYNNIQVSGNMVDLTELWADIYHREAICLPLKSDPSIQVQVHLVDLNCLPINTAECPICFNKFTTYINLCVNGHTVCDVCNNKIEICATCRQPMTKVRLIVNNIVANPVFTCPNAIKGCLFYGQENKDHLKYCHFTREKCPVCLCSYLKYEIPDHIKKECVKNLVIENQSICIIKWNFDMCKIVEDGNRFFKFNFTFDKESIDIDIEPLFRKYKDFIFGYQIQILDPNSMPVFKIVSDSTSLKAHDGAIRITANFFKNYVYENRLFVRFCIFLDV